MQQAKGMDIDKEKFDSVNPNNDENDESKVFIIYFISNNILNGISFKVNAVEMSLFKKEKSGMILQLISCIFIV